ncbi:MAG: hypothetical protein LUC33_01105 [Prevotellaceae bacterium]|nr:hypothetical protein [Prevotellaceae bacterium]
MTASEENLVVPSESEPTDASGYWALIHSSTSSSSPGEYQTYIANLTTYNEANEVRPLLDAALQAYVDAGFDTDAEVFTAAVEVYNKQLATADEVKEATSKIELLTRTDDNEFSEEDVVSADGKYYKITDGDNLVVNGGFELTDYSYGWQTGDGTDAFAGTPYSLLLDDHYWAEGGWNNGAYIDYSAIHVYHDETSQYTLEQTVAVEEGATYLFVCHTKGTDVSEDDADRCALLNMTDETTIATEDAVICYLVPDDGTDDWSRTTCVFTASSSYVGIVLAENKCCLDAFQLYKVEEATSDIDDVKAALEEVAVPTANIGEKAFQYNTDLVAALKTAVEKAQTMADDTNNQNGYTGAEYYAAIAVMQEAAASAAVLNAPAEGQAFNIIMETENTNVTGNALEFLYYAEQTEGSYAFQFATAPNANIAGQAFTFTPVDGITNGYTISFDDEDGTTHYLCAGTSNAYGIRATTTETNALTIVVKPTDTEGAWNLVNRNVNTNLGLTSDGASVYTTNDCSDLSLAEASGTIDWTLEAEYGTLALPFVPTEDETDGLTFYSTEAYEKGDILSLEDVTSLEANTPYIVGGETTGTYTFAVTTGVYRSYDSTDGITYTVPEAGWLTGTYISTEVPTGSYVLQNQTDNGLAFYIVTDDEPITIGANHCYLTASETAAAPAVIFLFPDGKTTAITGVEADVTEGSEAIYDLSGRKVSQTRKGIYIVNGKKVVIK